MEHEALSVSFSRSVLMYVLISACSMKADVIRHFDATLKQFDELCFVYVSIHGHVRVAASKWLGLEDRVLYHCMLLLIILFSQKKKKKGGCCCRERAEEWLLVAKCLSLAARVNALLCLSAFSLFRFEHPLVGG